MNSVISATTKQVYGAKVKPSRRDSFLAAAEGFLAAARVELDDGRLDQALEHAYLAALRTAGAVIASSEAIRKRKRLPSSAWDKLVIDGESSKRWAACFKGYSYQRGRVASGIELSPPRSVVVKLLADAEEFFAEVNHGQAPLAA